MNFMSSTRAVVTACSFAVIGLGLAGCGNALPPQHTEYGCPVQNAEEFKASLNGEFGADGLGRPLNSQRMPLDVDGNCLTEFPVAENAVYPLPALQPDYQGVYVRHYGLPYVYTPIVTYRTGIVVQRGPLPGRVVMIPNPPRNLKPAAAPVKSAFPASKLTTGAAAAAPTQIKTGLQSTAAAAKEQPAAAAPIGGRTSTMFGKSTATRSSKR